MSAHLFSIPIFSLITRLSACLVLLAASGSLQAADQWQQRARVNPNDAAAGMAFGGSVAIDGDTMVVGAYSDDRMAANGGVAYVFVKPEAGWPAVTQVARLTPSDPGSQDQFGWSVAMSGNTIVVGALYDDSPGLMNHGSAYVFVKPPSGWTDMTQTAKLTASDRQSLDEFGRSVAISGNTIVVGAPFDHVGSNQDQGSLYVFEKPGTGWITATETARLTASDGVAGDLLGYSLTISDNTIVAGAYGHNNGHGIGSGEAYVFDQSGGWTTATENARLTASDSAEKEYFGWSASIDGDLVVIGAPGETSFDNSGEDSAYVFVRPVGGWSGDRTETAILTASEGTIDDDFGHAVAASGDLVIVGAPTDDVAGEDKQGSAYVFSKPAGGWVNATEAGKLVASDGMDSDEFGDAVSLSGSVVAIGAHKDDLNVVNDNIGSVYIFSPELALPPAIFLPVLVR